LTGELTTPSAGNNGLTGDTVDISKRFVFDDANATVYCQGSGTAYVVTDKNDGTYGPPIVDNYMTAGADGVSICVGGSDIPDPIGGTNCFKSATARIDGQPVENFYTATGVSAPVAVTDGENSLSFKLWDFGVDYGNSKLVLELPANCSASPPVTNVGIDIKPGSYPNSVDLCSFGVVTVAILGSATFDVSDVDLDSLKFGSATPRTVGKGNKSSCNIKDVSGDFSVTMEGAADGYNDLVCQYETIDLGDMAGSMEAKVTGTLLSSGWPFEGTDTINIVKDSCE
jgi:hypothetical protein